MLLYPGRTYAWDIEVSQRVCDHKWLAGVIILYDERLGLSFSCLRAQDRGNLLCLCYVKKRRLSKSPSSHRYCFKMSIDSFIGRFGYIPYLSGEAKK